MRRQTYSFASLNYVAAFYVFCYGLWVLAWGPDEALSSMAFDTFRRNASAFGEPWRVIGVAAVLLGALYASAVFINGRGMMWTPIVRGLSCLFVVLFLANLGLSIASIQPSNTGVYTYIFAALAYFTLFCLNLGRFAESLDMIWGKLRGLVT